MKPTKTQRKAALLFCDWLETVPQHAWDYSYFINHCGTKGCAAGLGLIHGMIPGYVINFEDSINPPEIMAVDEKTGKLLTVFCAIKNAFGLDDIDINYIFYDFDIYNETRTPKKIVTTLRKIIE